MGVFVVCLLASFKGRLVKPLVGGGRNASQSQEHTCKHESSGLGIDEALD